MHLYRLFLRPAEVAGMCARHGLEVETVWGVRPVVGSLAFWKMLATGVVPAGFKFAFTRRPWVSYLGVARKRREESRPALTAPGQDDHLSAAAPAPSGAGTAAPSQPRFRTSRSSTFFLSAIPPLKRTTNGRSSPSRPGR